MELRQKDLAAVFRVSPRTIQRWEDKGLDRARKGPEATYDLAEAVAWALERAEADAYERGHREALTGDLEKVELKKQEMLARKHELDVEEREGRLVDVDEVEEDLAREFSQIRAALLAFPGRLAPRLDKYKTPEALAIIEPAVHELMEDLSRGDHDEA